MAPQTDRRGFLKLLAGAAASAAALVIDDPERALWVPGQKSIFLPPENRMTVEAATDADLLRFFPGQEVHRFSDLRWQAVDPGAPGGPFLVTVGGREGDDSTVRFDSKWQPIDGWFRNGRQMTERERVEVAHKMARTPFVRYGGA